LDHIYYSIDLLSNYNSYLLSFKLNSIIFNAFDLNFIELLIIFQLYLTYFFTNNNHLLIISIVESFILF